MDGEAVFESNGLLGLAPMPQVEVPPRLEDPEAGPSGTATEQDDPMDEGWHSLDERLGEERANQTPPMDADEVVPSQAGADGFESNGLLGMAPLPGPLPSSPPAIVLPATAPAAQVDSDPFIPLTDEELGIGPSAPASPPARLIRSLATLPVWKPPMEARTADGRAVQFRRKRKVADHYAGVGRCGERAHCRVLMRRHGAAGPPGQCVGVVCSARYASVQASRGDQGGSERPCREQVSDVGVARRMLELTRHRTRLQAQFDAEAIAPIPLGESSRANANPAAAAARKQMWVDKYRPSKFTDLLGEEVGLPVHAGMPDAETARAIQRCQREVLAWLKEWDRCVYKKIPPGNKKRPREGEENVYVRLVELLWWGALSDMSSAEGHFRPAARASK